MSTNIQIKGLKDGLLVSLGDGGWDDLHPALIELLRGQADFFRGGRLALDVGSLILKASDLGPLSKEISDLGLNLWAVIGESPATQRSAQAFGLATRLQKPEMHRSSGYEGSFQNDSSTAVLMRKTLRSGFSLQHPGHVVVIGDVNPGAQLIARGDIIVWGKLRGTVHAGADGDVQAVVCALDLSPTQLRIADVIAVTPKRRGKPQPEMARLEKGQVIAEAWDPKRERI